MLWRNDNTVVVGKYQNTREEINESYVKETGIKVVRRLSGGGAVYHDKGNLNFTFIVKDNSHGFDFNLFCIPIIKALAKFGITASFNGRNDITIDGKKFSGNSQYASGGRLLHHGCIMLNSDLGKVENALKVKVIKFQSKSTKSIKSRVTTINANASNPISMEDFKEALLQATGTSNTLIPYKLNKEELAEVKRLRNEKYVTWEWNYGKSPDYTSVCEKKYDSGVVSVLLKVSAGIIKDIKFYGDFFGNGDIEDLEDVIRGHKLSQNLLEVLRSQDVDYYINGLTSQDIFELLCGH